jgi:hypothetical protein
MLIELIGSRTPWMEPWDPTLEQLLDILRPEGSSSTSSSRAANIMYITVGGDLGTVDQNMDRESLRGLLLGNRTSPSDS